MPQQVLHRTNVVASFKQMGGPARCGINYGVAQGMTAHFSVDARSRRGIFHCLLNQAFMDMVSPHFAAAGIHRQAFQRTLPLLNLPLLDSRTIPKMFKKRTDIVGRTIPQLFSRPEINKSLRPFDIEIGTLRPHPILLQATLKSVPESFNRHRLVCIFFSHKTSQLQMVIALSPHDNRQNKYITERRQLATS
jgi:hypothetical protein